jgi:phage terminase large subunit
MATAKKAPINFHIPEAFKCLFTPSKYKVFYSGRGCGKTENFARALLLISMQKKVRILCTREVQSSIKQSVHTTLKDIILTHNLDQEFAITGLNGPTAISLKSIANIDFCWCEEANTLSQDSLDTLLPSIRGDGSEIWFSFNTLYETDPVYKMFVMGQEHFKPGELIVKRLTYRDNPYFTSRLMADMLREKARDYEKYLNIWEGNCLNHSIAAIFAGRYQEAEFTPDEDTWSPLYGCDFGFSDPTTLIKSWVYQDRLYVEYEVYETDMTIDNYGGYFDAIPGARTHVVYADNALPATIAYLRKNGFPRFRPCTKFHIQDGIELMKSFNKIIIHPRCKHTLQEFSLYSYKVDKLSGLILPKVEDRNNHTIDAIRYSLEPLLLGRKLKNIPLDVAEEPELDTMGNPISRNARVSTAYFGPSAYML